MGERAYIITQSIKKLKKEEKEWALSPQGFVPLYKRDRITDALHETSGFRTDYQFMTKSSMRIIQKKVKGKKKLLYSVTTAKIAVAQ